MVRCQTCESINGELKCVVSFLCIVNLRGGVMNIDLCNLFGLMVYITKWNFEPRFFWKFNVILGVYVV
jgi:hypothetical protein